MKKVSAFLLVLTLLVSLFSGCSKSTSNKPTEFKNVQLEFWNGFTGPDGKGMQKIIDQFNKEYEGKINVKTQVMQWGQYYDKIITSVTSGKAPDIGIMHVDTLPKYAKKGVIIPLDELAAKLDLKESDFIKAVWDAGIYEGKRYGIPLDVHPLGLYYNVDLLKQAGFDHPPTNMEEFLTMAKAMTKDTDGDGKIDQWGFAMPTLWPSHQIYWTVLHQFGGKATSDDGTEPLYTSQEAIDALQFLADTVFKYQISPKNITQDGEVTLFKQGKLGFHLNGIWMIAGFEEQQGLNFATAPVPQWGKQKAVWAGSHQFVIFKQKEQDPVKLEAAMTFIDYITKHSIEWARAGQVPARNSVRESDEFKSLKHQMGFAQQADYLVFPVSSPYFPDAWGPSGEAVTNVILGKDTPASALQKAADKARKQVQANKE
ncbi:ABC transporter substrate-binding protein [Caloramator australicus]|uniref:ABC transporter, sugar binding protein n=1 Tax=Caloramator australicus RC3 TaxID=857293 RepID=I7LFP9_9CLOT|nr:ABC transporter substrate-binding protein [Caloramator australicus]CCJ32675.1 ABC transporter, sugar binding protein [Caloramator australicus RC3]